MAKGGAGKKTSKSRAKRRSKASVVAPIVPECPKHAPMPAARIGRCCSPEPGEHVVGIVDDDGGVSVHAVRCEHRGAEFMALDVLPRDIQLTMPEGKPLDIAQTAGSVDSSDEGTFSEPRVRVDAGHGWSRKLMPGTYTYSFRMAPNDVKLRLAIGPSKFASVDGPDQFDAANGTEDQAFNFTVK
jgi:hypothetical protein